MRKCPKCGEEVDVVENICPHCDAELSAPYEGLESYDDDGEEETGEILTPLPAGGGAELLASLGIGLEPGGLPPAELTILSGATIYLGETVLDPGTLLFARGRIITVLDGAMADLENGATFYDLTGMILSAGFIDIHIHGMMGVDTNKASAEDFKRLSAEAAKHGLTALVPTTVACPPEELRRVLENVRTANKEGTPGARLLGVHLESNFISMDFKGAQPPGAIFSPNDMAAWQITPLLDEYADEVLIVTLAPELPGATDMIHWLRERGIIASLGHSAANYDQAVAGFAAGATHATHLFNAMAPMHYRNPGLVGAALENDAVFTEMVCDGVHVHPAVIATVITAKGAERFVPVSDGTEGAGMREGEFLLGGQHVTVKDGIARLDSGTIAGSTTTMDAILRLLVERVGWDLGEALTMCSTTPAEALEMHSVGRIAPGAFADLVVLNEGLQVRMTFVNGKLVYQG